MNFFLESKPVYLTQKLKYQNFKIMVLREKIILFMAQYPERISGRLLRLNVSLMKIFFTLIFQILMKNKFFLAKDVEIDNYLNKNLNNLISLNNFTNTSPIEFRSNLFVYINNKGFSSYQSEYPFNMSKKKGSIFSPLGTLLDSSAEKNILFFKNIYFEPTIEKSKLNKLDIKKKKIIEK